MTDMRERVLAAFYGRVQAAGVGFNARYPMGVAESVILDTPDLPAAIQLDGGDEVADPIGLGQLRIDTTVAVALVLKASSWAAVPAALNAARALVRNAVAADRTLGDLVVDVAYGGMEMPDRPFDDAAAPFGLAILHFTILGVEAENDATEKG